MTPDDLARLKAAALAATNGPWALDTEPGFEFHVRTGGTASVAPSTGQPIADFAAEEDAAYVALANPATILALLAEREGLKRDKAFISREVDKWCERECAVCPEDCSFEDKIKYEQKRAEAAEADATALRAQVETMQAALSDAVLSSAHKAYEVEWRADFINRRNHSSDKAHAAGLVAMRAVLQKALTLPPKETP